MFLKVDGEYTLKYLLLQIVASNEKKLEHITSLSDEYIYYYLMN